MKLGSFFSIPTKKEIDSVASAIVDALEMIVKERDPAIFGN